MEPINDRMAKLIAETPEARKCVQGHTRGNLDKCQNMRCTYEGMDGERYRCDRCGESYFLDYEEMR